MQATNKDFHPLEWADVLEPGERGTLARVAKAMYASAWWFTLPIQNNFKGHIVTKYGWYESNEAYGETG